MGTNSKGPDTILFIVALTLALLGVAMVFSSSYRIAEVSYGDPSFFLKKQLAFLFLGILAMLMALRLPLAKIRPYIYPALAILLILLVVVFFPEVGGKRVKGAARWLSYGPFSLQVSELVKLALVFFLADYLSRKQESLSSILRGSLLPLAIITPFLLLIFLQPDYGSAVIICLAAITIMLLGGARIKHLLAVGLPILAVFVLLIVVKPYRLARVEAFFNPWDNRETVGFQIVQSLMSYGSGGTFGVGIGNGLQKLYYLPEAHTDFILSIIAEEAGLFGVSLILALFFLVMIRGALITLKAPDRFSALLAAGITLLIGLQASLNIASSMALIPPKGTALPLVSYGGTALIVNMTAVGLLLNISRNGREKTLSRIIKMSLGIEEKNWQQRQIL